jgi:hypothetical protein
MYDERGYDLRRLAPRIGIEAFCSEIVDDEERHAMVLDLSANGFRLMRPFATARQLGDLQLELELPGVDEIIWARGQVCFERVVSKRGGGLVLTTGVRVAAAASRDRRLLRDYVLEHRRAQAALATR